MLYMLQCNSSAIAVCCSCWDAVHHACTWKAEGWSIARLRVLEATQAVGHAATVGVQMLVLSKEIHHFYY
jgi:hypothetical protein